MKLLWLCVCGRYYFIDASRAPGGRTVWPCPGWGSSRRRATLSRLARCTPVTVYRLQCTSPNKLLVVKYIDVLLQYILLLPARAPCVKVAYSLVIQNAFKWICVLKISYCNSLIPLTFYIYNRWCGSCLVPCLVLRCQNKRGYPLQCCVIGDVLKPARSCLAWTHERPGFYNAVVLMESACSHYVAPVSTLRQGLRMSYEHKCGCFFL